MYSGTTPITARLEPGSRIGPYELLLRIGQGGMASVWLAREADASGFVAIKTVLAEHAGDDALRTMMIDEALIAQAVDHPNVARTLSVGELWGMPYLVLEYVPGQSLEGLCKGRADDEPMPPAVMVRLIVDTCAGLHAAHELVGEDGKSIGLVHRDLSTHNVLVDEHGHVKLIDFGIAKANERLTKTASGLTKGKLPYMAPEQALAGSVDRRADLWSLGAVMVELLTGTVPFDGADNEGLMDKLSGEPHEPLPERVPKALRDVIDRALSFEAEDRYASAAELSAALAAAVPPASLEEVAEVVRQRLGAALSMRKRAVEQSLAAAAVRAEAREILRAGGAPSSRRRQASPTTPKPEKKTDRGSDPKLVAEDADREMSRQSMAYVAVAAVALVVLAAYVLGSQAARKGETPRVAPSDPDASVDLPPPSLPGARVTGPPSPPRHVNVSEGPKPLLATPALSSFATPTTDASAPDAAVDAGADAARRTGAGGPGGGDDTIY